MAEQTGRQVSLEILDGLEVIKFIDGFEGNQFFRKGLRISFNVKRRVSPTADTTVIKIYNLAPSSRGELAQRSAVWLRKDPLRTVRLTAGFKDRSGIIFTGALMKATNTRQGADWITEIEASAAFGNALLNTLQRSWKSKSGTSVKKILKELFDAAGFPGVVFSPSAEKVLSQRNLKTKVVSGSAYETLRNMLDSYGLTFTIDTGQATVTKPGFPFKDEKEVDISEFTGMIGTPRVTNLGAEIRVLLDPRIRPGIKFGVTSQSISESVADPSLGHTFTAWEVTCQGDTHSDDWFSDISAWFFPPLVQTGLIGGR